MASSHKIIKRENIRKFKQRIRYYSDSDIHCTHHTFFRLSEKQKLEFNCDTIIDFLKNQDPVLVGLQQNGCFAAFYKYPRQRFIRIINSNELFVTVIPNTRMNVTKLYEMST